MAMQKLLTAVLILLFVNGLWSQETDLKQQAITAFTNENYPEAIALLKQVVKEQPDDAEAWFLLGWYTHYLCYDSRPFAGYNQKISDEILSYLGKVLDLNPKLGNARYFIGAEHGVRFGKALIAGDIEQAKIELKAGYNKGAFPAWMIEYGRNILNACEPNAILFVGGDAEVNPIRYLQFVEGYRTDITVIPAALTNIPSFVLFLKDGLKDLVPSIPTSWT